MSLFHKLRSSGVKKRLAIKKEYISEKTGNAYTTLVIEKMAVVSTGSIEQTDDNKYRYYIIDTIDSNGAGNMEYAIKTTNKVDVKLGTQLTFFNVRGGETAKGGWYAADRVEIKTK